MSLSSGIFVIDAGFKDFVDQNHLNNFCKYLFSISKQHNITQSTKYNYYYVEGCTAAGKFNISPSAQYREFYESLNDKPNELINDLFYVAFVYKLNGIIYSNILTQSGNEITLTIPPDLHKLILSKYFTNSNEQFSNALIKLATGCKIVNISELNDGEIREKIEHLVHASINEEFPVQNVVLGISHHDQDFLHIHRLRLK